MSENQGVPVGAIISPAPDLERPAPRVDRRPTCCTNCGAAANLYCQVYGLPFLTCAFGQERKLRDAAANLYCQMYGLPLSHDCTSNDICRRGMGRHVKSDLPLGQYWGVPAFVQRDVRPHQSSCRITAIMDSRTTSLLY